jgi:acyl-CoA synthetase (NDP forming)
MKDLNRLFKPKSIAVVGGGSWCESVIKQLKKINFNGEIWPIHPKRESISGIKSFKNLNDIPYAPDSTFIGVNRFQTIEIVKELSKFGAGGAVCFASGFLEAKTEDTDAEDLQQKLLKAAKHMPILGPNCYGFINYLDGILLWPDQHGGIRVNRGVGIITQSSNIAINISMQQRALPIAALVAAGNQAQIDIATIGSNLLQDDRITALGIHIEGIKDLSAFEELAKMALKLKKRIIVLKVGLSKQAQLATISHTASLTGTEAGANALFKRLGIARVKNLPIFLETLKLLHVTGPLKSKNLASVSCSGGEASLVADIACGYEVVFPELNDRQTHDLREALGPMVALANPLDYHTYIWRDTKAMTLAWSAIMDPSIALTLLILDFPRPDRCDTSDWQCAIDAAISSKKNTETNVAVVATLPELLPEEISQKLIMSGIVPMFGIEEAISAAEAAAIKPPKLIKPILKPLCSKKNQLIPEGRAKEILSRYGLAVPKSTRAKTPNQAANKSSEIGFPLVLKGEGFAHKTEANAVVLNILNKEQVIKEATHIGSTSFLLEEMITDNIAELLVGVVRDPAHGFILSIAAGGTFTELIKDTTSLIIPIEKDEILKALEKLRIYSLINGYRGNSKANLDAIIDAIISIQNFVIDNSKSIEEIEVNPLICGREKAIAADLLLRRS